MLGADVEPIDKLSDRRNQDTVNPVSARRKLLQLKRKNWSKGKHYFF